ncbi:MAG: glycosyltransferase family 4 protein [Culicoidibacterales bacterium]
MKKILFVASVQRHFRAFHMPYLEYWYKQGYEVHTASLLDKKKCEDVMEKYPYIIWHNIDFDRSPFSKQTVVAYKQLKALMNQHSYELIHVHTPVASILGRLAAKNAHVPKIVYTAHGFHFFKGAPIPNWLIYYPIEKYMSRYTDALITINKEDYLRAKKKFRVGKVFYSPGVGIDLNKFTDHNFEQQAKRKELGLTKEQLVLLSVGELNKNKNHEVIIRAIKNLNNPNLKYFIAGEGSLEPYLQKLIGELGLTQQVKLLGYRTDIHELCQVCDVFCFPSYREGLGLAAIEALAAGKPLITGTTRGIDDYSVDGVTGFKSQGYSVEGFTEAIQKYLDNRELFDPNLLKNEAKKFSNSEVQKIMNQIYEEIIHDQSITR